MFDQTARSPGARNKLLRLASEKSAMVAISVSLRPRAARAWPIAAVSDGRSGYMSQLRGSLVRQPRALIILYMLVRWVTVSKSR